MFIEAVLSRTPGLLCLLAVSLSFCKEQDKQAAALPKKFLYTTDSGVSFREEPKATGKLIRILKAGERVEYVTEETDAKIIGGMKGVWTCVNHEGKEGWIFGYFLSKEKEEPLVALEYATPEAEFFGRLEESVNSRKAPLEYSSEEKFRLTLNTACLEGGGSDRECIGEGPIQLEFNKAKKTIYPSFGVYGPTGEREIKSVTKQDPSQFEISLSEPIHVPGGNDVAEIKNTISVTIKKKAIEVIFGDGKLLKFRWKKG